LMVLERAGGRYPVVFRAAGVAPAAGALVIEEDELVLAGRGPEGPVELRVRFAELSDVRIGRRPEERLHGRPTLVLTRESGPELQVEPFGIGLAPELCDLLAGLATAHTDLDSQIAVVVPLKRGSLERAKELVAKGPPFDLAALELTRHEVFLGPEQAVFVFAGPHVRATLEQATRDPRFWRVGIAWRACIGGKPRLMTISDALRDGEQQKLVYSWTAT
jgi:hypothetical protein